MNDEQENLLGEIMDITNVYSINSEDGSLTIKEIIKVLKVALEEWKFT